MTRGILHVNYLGIIIGLIIAIGVQFMTIKELRQFSVETGVNCIRNSKTIVVPHSGHNIILENPIFVSRAVKNFILGVKNDN